MVASSRGTRLALRAAMPKPPSLENRVRILEGRVTKLEQLPARIDAAFARFSKEITAKLDEHFAEANGERPDIPRRKTVGRDAVGIVERVAAIAHGGRLERLNGPERIDG